MKRRIIENHEDLMNLNLQFFAEEPDGAPDGTPEGEPKGEGSEGETEPKTKTYDDALSEIAAARAEAKKLKAERDAALKKSGEATKALREKMTEAEREAERIQQEQEEHNEYVKELESFKQRTMAKDRYLAQGMKADLAEKAAEAEISGDMDALVAIQAEHTQSLIKAKEAEWKSSRPRLNMGDGDSSMTKEEILAIADRDERQKAMAQNLHLFT